MKSTPTASTPAPVAACFEVTLATELGGQRELYGREPVLGFIKKASKAVNALVALLAEADRSDGEKWMVPECLELLNGLTFELEQACGSLCDHETGAKG